MWAAQDGALGPPLRESHCVSRCWLQRFRDRGVALPMTLRFMGRRSSRCRWWSCLLPSVCLSVNLLGGTCLCTAGLRCPRAALTDDLAGTMQFSPVPLDEPLLASHEVSYMTSIPNFLSKLVKLVSQQRRPQRFNVFHSLAAATPQHRACKTLSLSSLGKHKTERQSCIIILRAAPHVSP